MDISLVEGCHRLPCSFITYNYEMDKVQLRTVSKTPGTYGATTHSQPQSRISHTLRPAIIQAQFQLSPGVTKQRMGTTLASVASVVVACDCCCDDLPAQVCDCSSTCYNRLRAGWNGCPLVVAGAQSSRSVCCQELMGPAGDVSASPLLC